MKKLGILFASVFLLGLVFQSCNNGKTYAEMKEEEREAIKRFIEREDINVISFEQFQNRILRPMWMKTSLSFSRKQVFICRLWKRETESV